MIRYTPAPYHILIFITLVIRLTRVWITVLDSELHHAAEGTGHWKQGRERQSLCYHQIRTPLRQRGAGKLGAAGFSPDTVGSTGLASDLERALQQLLSLKDKVFICNIKASKQ